MQFFLNFLQHDVNQYAQVAVNDFCLKKLLVSYSIIHIHILNLLLVKAIEHGHQRCRNLCGHYFLPIFQKMSLLSQVD